MTTHDDTANGDSPFPDRTASSTADAAREKQLKRWAVKRYAVADLARLSQHPWARRLAADIQRGDARRDPVKYPPTLMFSGDSAVKAGATDPQMVRLRELADDEIAQLTLRGAAMKADARNLVNEEARKLATERAASEIEIVERVDLTTWVPSPVPWVIDGLLARNATMGVFAERKAGKTTLIEDLVPAALDGRQFVGKFAVNLPADADVVLLDTEMPTDTLHGHYQRAGVKNLRRLDLRPLRGRERALDVRSDTIRARWASEITPGSLIILDCLYTLFGALGVSENSDEVVEVLAGIRALAAESAACGLVLVHHLGKDTERGARGHSSLEGFPDVNVRIELDGPPSPDTPRIFSAYGRDVAVEQGVLTLGDDGRLTLGGNPKAEKIVAKHRADDDAVWALIERNSGLSVRGLYELPVEQRGKLSRDRIREAVERLGLTNRIVNKGSDAAPEWHALTGVDPFTTPDQMGV